MIALFGGNEPVMRVYEQLIFTVRVSGWREGVELGGITAEALAAHKRRKT
jgi:hypothetical protein